MRPVFYMLLLIAVSASSGAAKELSDKSVTESPFGKLAVFPIEKIGNLDALIRANEIELEVACFSISDVLEALGLPADTGVVLEQVSAMRWSFSRLKITSSYELWIQSGFAKPGKEKVFAVSVLPSIKGVLGEGISNRSEWGLVTIDKKGNWQVAKDSSHEDPNLEGSEKRAETAEQDVPPKSDRAGW